jgi:transposase InsO family protein
MLTPQLKEEIALKKFSLISPVINGQVENQKQYFQELCSKPIEMPHYGIKRYSPKTLANWLGEYRRHGFDALKPGNRSDRGQSRKITAMMAEKIVAKIEQFPRLKASVLYDELVEDGVFSPATVSISTFYRYLSANPKIKAMTGYKQDAKERKRFAYENVNVLWQADLMYGPYLKDGRKKKRTYLIAFIDDASRLITFSQFCFEQNFLAMRAVLKEAVARRGIPTLIYTDQGKIYRSQQLQLICARMGCSVIHAEPFDPKSKGKIERFFQTARTRFLAKFDPEEDITLEELNQRYFKWLEDDYQQKIHSGTGRSPLEFFMSQADRVKMVTDPKVLDEYFLLREERKVEADGNISVQNLKYQVDSPLILAGKRVEVRFEPEWIGQAHYLLPLYIEDKKIGDATLVDFASNAKAKRNRPGAKAKETDSSNVEKTVIEPTPPALSFSSIYNTASETEEGES